MTFVSFGDLIGFVGLVTSFLRSVRVVPGLSLYTLMWAAFWFASFWYLYKLFAAIWKRRAE